MLKGNVAGIRSAVVKLGCQAAQIQALYIGWNFSSCAGIKKRRLLLQGPLLNLLRFEFSLNLSQVTDQSCDSDAVTASPVGGKRSAVVVTVLVVGFVKCGRDCLLVQTADCSS